MKVCYKTKRGGCITKWISEKFVESEIKRLFDRKTEATAKDNDNNIIGKVWKTDEGKWNYFVIQTRNNQL